MKTKQSSIDELNNLISTYKFSEEVLKDVDKRISDFRASSTDDDAIDSYVGQQVRYLKNILNLNEKQSEKGGRI